MLKDRKLDFLLMVFNYWYSINLLMVNFKIVDIVIGIKFIGELDVFIGDVYDFIVK